MSALFENAIDSLQVGMRFFQDDNAKHAILSVFHSVELLFKEILYRKHPILIYRNIDKKLSDESLTVGLREAIARFDNVGIHLSDDDKETVLILQKRRNQIEHHRYDPEFKDPDTLGRALRFILEFIHSRLNKKAEDYIEPDLLKSIYKVILTYEERSGLAEHELDKWIAENYPNSDEASFGDPNHFDGTEDCPICQQTFLVIDDPHAGTHCFFCQQDVTVKKCESCGVPFIPESTDGECCEYCEPAE